MNGKFTVEMESQGCIMCGHDSCWVIVYPNRIAGSTSYSDKENAEDLAEDLQYVWDLAMEQAATLADNHNAATAFLARKIRALKGK